MAIATTRPTHESSTSPLDAALARIRAAEDFPAVTGKLQQLMEVLGDADANVQHLANLIIQDYGLTVKLLRTAHSFRFNRSGVPVVSATHAIVMMGSAAVRDLVSSITLFDHFNRRSPAARPLLMLSLLSANHARELASGTGRREEAYLLGMLCNLGEVLVASYMPKEYAEVLKDMAAHQCSAAASCRRVLQFDYDELARAVAREWQMPESVTRLLWEDRNPDPVHKAVAFAHQLTTAVYRDGTATSHAAVNALLHKYSNLGLTRDDVGSVLRNGIEGTRETFGQAGIQINALQLKHQMTAAMIEHPDSIAAGADESPAEPAKTDESASAFTEVKKAVANLEVDLNKAILMILEATLRAGHFDRAVLALVSSTRRDVSARLALGRTTDDFVARFRFPLGPAGGPIGTAVSRGQELIIAKSWELVREEQRLLGTLGTGTVVLLPVTLNGRAVGALYVDSRRATPPPETAIAAARQMRDAIVAAMIRRGPSAQADARAS
jgi:HD-like signal output (HDOD) protein